MAESKMAEAGSVEKARIAELEVKVHDLEILLARANEHVAELEPLEDVLESMGREYKKLEVRLEVEKGEYGRVLGIANKLHKEKESLEGQKLALEQRVKVLEAELSQTLGAKWKRLIERISIRKQFRA